MEFDKKNKFTNRVLETWWPALGNWPQNEHIYIYQFLKTKQKDSSLTCGGSYIAATVARIPKGTFSCLSYRPYR